MYHICAESSMAVRHMLMQTRMLYIDASHWQTTSTVLTSDSCSPSSPFLQLLPHIHYLSLQFSQIIQAKMTCAECGTDESVNGTSLLICGKCKNHQYCGTHCQKKNWPTHKKNCRKPLLPQDIRALPENVPCVFTTPGFMPSGRLIMLKQLIFIFADVELPSCSYDRKRSSH